MSVLDPNTEEILSAKAAAQRVNATPQTIVNWIARGWLRGAKLGGQWRTSAEALAEMGVAPPPDVVPPATQARLYKRNLKAAEASLKELGV